MVEVAGFEIVGKRSERLTGAVWKAIDLKDPRTVALKQVRAASPRAGSRLRAEAAVLARVPHPNIVQVYDVVRSVEALWVVEEWVPGMPLDEFAAEGIDHRQAISLILGALQGLAHAHERGIVHGDVNPANILVATGNRARLIDFGLAGPIGTAGVPAAAKFTSPECTRGRVPTPASDVFSAAAVLATLLTATPTRSGSKVESIPAPLRPVLNRALSTEPTDRYADASVLLAALRQAADESFTPEQRHLPQPFAGMSTAAG
jgi:serine/threonine-protein kinase